MLDMNRADFDAQIERMKAQFEERKAKAGSALVTAVTNSCAAVEGTAKMLMHDAVTDSTITYGKHGHHPSVPGSAPAVDAGTLRDSVVHSVVIDNESHVVGTVGSNINNPPYGSYLEYGTSKMQPRPWLQPALDRNRDYMEAQFKAVTHAQD